MRTATALYESRRGTPWAAGDAPTRATTASTRNVGLISVAMTTSVDDASSGPGWVSEHKRFTFTIDIHRTAMYNSARYGPEQGPGCRFRDAARARHPCRRRQLRLRHHQARHRVVRRPPAMDRRHALPRAAPARAPGSRRRQVGGGRDWPQA